MSVTLAYSDGMVFSIVTTESVAVDSPTGKMWTGPLRPDDETEGFQVDPAGLVADELTVYVAPVSGYEREEMKHGMAAKTSV